MKKIILVFCVLVFLLASFAPCYADSEEESMVYEHGEKLDIIYETIQKDSYDLHLALKVSSLKVLKESITPVYKVDLLETARSGEITIIPMWCSHTGLLGDGVGNVYTAKTITSDGKFGGNIMFYIEKGVAYNMIYSPSEYSPMWFENGNHYPASASYADHAKRIAAVLKEKDMISPHDVKYVVADTIGEFFYVDNAAHSVFVSVGYISNNETGNFLTDYYMDEAGLINLAKDYSQKREDFLNEKASWEASHPGEIWDKTEVYGLSPIMSDCSSVDNIIDITDYLNIEIKAMQVSQESDISNRVNNTKGKAHSGLIIGIISGIALIAMIIVISSIYVIRQKKPTLDS